MSFATSQRAGRSSKDRPKQPPHSTQRTPTEGQKTADSVVPKIQPTAEQMRIAQIIYDANKSEYPDLKDKVDRIIEVTGRTKDDALVALHDCDNDSNRATIMLLEGNEDEGKWETSGKKKKNRQPQQKVSEVNGHEPAPADKDEKEPVVESTSRGRGQKSREGTFRYRGPPRMNRGGNQNRNWRNKENEKNERNLQEGRRERNNEGRSRGPRRNFSGRGRGRGGRSRTFQNRGLQNSDGFPESIDTWNNSTAEKGNIVNPADATLTVGNWSDVAVAEEWSEEDWTENLTETKVFTPSNGTQSSAVVGLDIPVATALGQNIDLASFLQQKPVTNTDQNSNMPATNGPSVGQSSLLSQQLPQLQQNVVPQAHFDFNQFAKQAEAQIKAAVGVVSVQNTPAVPSLNSNSFQSNSASYPSSYSVNSSNQHHVQLPPELQQVVSQSSYSSTSSSAMHISRDLHSPVSSQQSLSNSAVKTATSQHQAPLPPRAKAPPKARLPPPSKIPESAVVMPDDAVTSLDVQFGALQFGTDSSPFDFTASENINSYQDVSQSSSGSSHVNSQALPSSITSQAYSNALPSSVTMSKESTYSIGSLNSQSQTSISNELNQSQKISNQESMLLSQSEHKSVENVSSYVNHRSNQANNLENSMISSKSDQGSLNSFNTSTHDTSAYSYSNPKSVLNSSNLVPSTVTNYTHTSSPMNSGSNDMSCNQSPQSKYQGQVAAQGQNASSYGSGSSSYGLQATPYSTSVTTTASTYSSQSGYSSSASYGANNSGYNSQQNVYSGSVTTTTAQSGSMISTSVSNSKLSNSLNHGVKDSSSLLESQHSSSQHYDGSSTTASSSVLSVSSLAQTSSTNHSAQNSANMNSVLGLVSTSSSTTTTSVLKNSLSASKAVPNIPQNMPAAMLGGHQYIMGQASLPFYGLQQPMYSYEDVQMLQSKLSSMGLQSPLYSYEDVQMLQSKLSTLGYYDMQFQAPTSMTGRDPGMSSVAYTTDGKYSRADTDASTAATTLSQGQANSQAHGQAFLNPAAALPPGYGYYFAGGMMGGIHHYAAPPIFPVPPASNTHGATSNTQFQKANAYGSHSYSSGYDSLSQQQDYTKSTYGTASQNQVKGVSGSGAVADLSGSVYSKAHAAQLAKSYDKPGFHTGTPPPFNLAGSQATGPLGASSGPYATQFIPVLTHGQHHSTALLHHHMQQDATQTGGTPAAGQRGPQGLGQQKNNSKQSYAYWTSN